MKNDKLPKTLQEAILYFADEQRCLEFLSDLRWPDGPACPHCGSQRVSFLERQRRFQCSTRHAHRQFSVKVGTIFEDSPLPLSKWLPAIWLIGNAKNGISSYEIARGLNVTQKTAWFMLHRIRLAMQDDDKGPFSGKVEVDETYIGGKARNMHKSKREKIPDRRGGMGKVAVMGLLERHSKTGKSRVRTKIIADTSRRTIPNAVREDVTVNSELYTDALYSYNDLNDEYIHNVIDHAEKYVDGQIHTNGVENFWSLLKRAIRGSYVSIEPFHLFRYLDEEAFRFNSRNTDDSTRFQKATIGISGKRLTYSQLTGKELATT